MSRLSSSVFILLLYLLPLQDLLASLFYGLGMPALFVRGIILTKEMLVLPLGFYIAVSTHLRPGRRLVLLLLLYASALMFLSPIPITERLIGYRTYLLLFFSFVLGESIGRGRIPQKRFFQHIKIVLGLVITFGLLEHLVLPTTIWNNLFPIFDMKRDVLALTGGELGSTGLPLNAYSAELGKRMLGPFNEPLYMAYFTVLLLNFLFARYLCRKAVNPLSDRAGSHCHLPDSDTRHNPRTFALRSCHSHEKRILDAYCSYIPTDFLRRRFVLRLVFCYHRLNNRFFTGDYTCARTSLYAGNTNRLAEPFWRGYRCGYYFGSPYPDLQHGGFPYRECICQHRH